MLSHFKFFRAPEQKRSCPRSRSATSSLSRTTSRGLSPALTLDLSIYAASTLRLDNIKQEPGHCDPPCNPLKCEACEPVLNLDRRRSVSMAADEMAQNGTSCRRFVSSRALFRDREAHSHPDAGRSRCSTLPVRRGHCWRRSGYEAPSRKATDDGPKKHLADAGRGGFSRARRARDTGM